MHFDLFDLRLFVFVAEENNLRRGAERACISLAAASTRIKQLEENMGAKMLYRKAHGVELTPAGEALLRHARRVLQQVEHLECEPARSRNRPYTAGVKGHVRLLANTTSITSAALPSALASFLAQQPGVSIDLHERLSQDIVIAINEAQADIGIVAGDVDTEGLGVRPFASDELVVVVPAGQLRGDLPDGGSGRGHRRDPALVGAAACPHHADPPRAAHRPLGAARDEDRQPHRHRPAQAVDGTGAPSRGFRGVAGGRR